MLSPSAEPKERRVSVARRMTIEDVGDDNESIVSVEEPVTAKLVSVQGVIALLCLFGVISSTVLATVLSEVSCDNALDKTDTASDASTAECFSTAEDALQTTVNELLGYAAVGVEGMIDAFIDKAQFSVRQIRVTVIDVFGNTTKDHAFVQKTAPYFWHQMKAADTGATDVGALASPIRGVGFFADGSYYHVHRFRKYLWGVLNNPIAGLNLSYHSWLGRCYDVTGLPRMFGVLGDDYAPVKMAPLDLEGIALSRGGFIKDGEMRWSSIQSLGNFLGFQLTERLVDPAGYNKDLEAIVFVMLDNIGHLLKGVAHQASILKDASAPRIFLTVASSWVAEAKRARGDADWEKHSQVNSIVGASAGDTTDTYVGIEPLSGLNLTLSRMLPDINATDPIIRGVARAIQARGGYRSLLSTNTSLRGSASLAIDVVDQESGNVTHERHLVALTRMQRKEGIDWWMVLSIDEASVLNKVHAAQAATAAAIEQSKDSVQDDVRVSRRETQIILVVVAVVLLVACLYVTYRVVAPIKRMQESMSRVALMQLEDGEITSLSSLYEVRHMQQDFTKMVDCLKEYRAYVPTSLLDSLVRADPPSGNIAVMFTDIQGSTALWKRSALDMDEALEMHNETIRSHYASSGAYEVKTIGDAFMISFEDPVKAVGFGLEIQQDLAKQSWPPALELPDAGLVIRIGVNCGPTITESNPVTGRVDYRGSTVNMAARVESKALGGTVCITSDLLALVKPHMSSLNNPEVGNHGTHDLKGLGGHQLYLLVPTALKHRLSKGTTDCAPGNATPADDASMLSQPLSRSGRRSKDDESVHSESLEHHASFKKKQKENVKAVKTQLQLTKGSVTIAVCRLVCHITFVSPHHPHFSSTWTKPKCSLPAMS